MAFTFDIKGQLNSMRLSEGKVLWPLYEAVVNSIQAIEDSENKGCGKISIYVKRTEDGQTNVSGEDRPGRIESIVITDNGVGSIMHCLLLCERTYVYGELVGDYFDANGFDIS